MLTAKVDLDGKIGETIMPFKDIEAFQKFLETLYELFDEGSTITQEAVILTKPDKKSLNKNIRGDFVKGIQILSKKKVL